MTLVKSEPASNEERVVLLRADPKQMTASCCRKNETPSALISGAIRGARFSRSGRYANRSMTTPSKPAPSIAAANMSAITTAIGSGSAARRRATSA